MQSDPSITTPHKCLDYASAVHSKKVETVERFWGVGGAFTYLICPHCGSWFLSPPPSDDLLSEHYQGYYPKEEYEQRLKEPITAVERTRAKETVQVLKKLDFFDELNDVLDIGAGCGGFLAALGELSNVSLSGCDQNPKSTRFAKQLFDIELQTGEVSSLDPKAQSYDLITLWHCFEHVRDPQQTLADIRPLLRTKGLLLIEVPTPGFWAQLFKGSWLFLQAPTHLNLFTQSALIEHLSAAGFTVAQVQRPWSPSEWAGSMLFRMGFSGFMPRLYFGPKRFQDHLWRLLFFALMPIDLLLTGISAILGRSGLLRVYARLK